MDSWTQESEAAFLAYVDDLVKVIGHADRADPLRDYCLGLLMPLERKSVEPMAAVTAPARVAAKHQSLVGRGRDGAGPPSRAADRRAARPDPGLDRR
jgi:SRSO17 transposase